MHSDLQFSKDYKDFSKYSTHSNPTPAVKQLPRTIGVVSWLPRDVLKERSISCRYRLLCDFHCGLGIGTSADQDCGGCDSFGRGKIIVTMAFFSQCDVPNAQTAPLAVTAHLLFVATIPQTHNLTEAPPIKPDFRRGEQNKCVGRAKRP